MRVLSLHKENDNSFFIRKVKFQEERQHMTKTLLNTNNINKYLPFPSESYKIIPELSTVASCSQPGGYPRILI